MCQILYLLAGYLLLLLVHRKLRMEMVNLKPRFRNVALGNLPENQKHFASMTILPCYGGLTFCLFSIISGINYSSTNLLTKDNSEKKMRQK
jgi:hypothetical protein